MKNLTSNTNKKFNFTNRFLTGMVIALALTLTAFEWTTVTSEPYVFPESEIDEVVEIVPPLRFKIKELKKPEPQKKSDQIKAVEELTKPKEVDEPEKKPEEQNIEAQPDTNIVDQYSEETLVEIDVNQVYTSVQIFAHYDECAQLRGEELMECSKLAIMKQVSENFVISEWLKDVGGRQAALASFVVDQDGNIADIKILRTTSKPMKRAAKKALEKLPPMNPAVQQGRKVKLQMKIPIIVRL